MADDLSEILLQPDQLSAKIKELGRTISRDYADKDPLLIGVLKGAVVFLSDLLREITVPVSVDFMAVSSYGAATKSSGIVRILKDLDESIEGRHVLVVEDIVDTGLTLHYMLENLSSRHPASLKVCALLDKPERRQVAVPVDYIGFHIPDKFVVGYGLDYAEKYRNLPYIGVLRPDRI
ncbi:MAG: hypoxanthine phosphoribosyltransferase [Betaproteobacteria bacterium]